MIAKSDWELLDIEPTMDIRQIKKAYAKRLKLSSPEDDSVQFQILRQAYERVLQYAEHANSSILTVDTFDTEDSANKEGSLYDPYDEESEVVKNGYVKIRCVENKLGEPEIRKLTDPMPVHVKFMQQVNDLYANFNRRIDPKKWDEIIKDEMLWDVETYRILKTWFLDFLYDEHFVPSEVLQSYYKYFLWEFNSEEFHQKYGELFLTYIKEQIDGNIVPGYEYLMQECGEDIETYIKYREYGFAQYLSGDWNNANQNLYNAIEMIPYDPYLMCVYGAYNDAVNSTNGKKYIKLGAEFSADPWRMFLFSGQLLQRIGKFKKALRYFRKIPKTSYYYIAAQLGITECLCRIKRYHKCGFLLRSRLKKNREDIELKDVISQYYIIILDLKKRFPNRLVFWYEASKIFPYVSKYGEKNPYKFTPNYILPSLKLVAIPILVVLFIIGLIATRGGVVVPIIFIYIIYSLAQFSELYREETFNGIQKHPQKIDR